LRNALDQMLIKGAPFEACHGKHGRGIPTVLTGVEFGECDRAQTGIEVKVELGL